MPLRATLPLPALVPSAIRRLPSVPGRPAVLATLAAAALAGGCQAVPPDATGDHSLLSSAPPVTRGLDADGLSTLLTAELAGQRERYREATRGYLKAAERYPDPELAKRATFAARFGDSPDLLKTAATRWQALAPDSATPNRLLSALAVQRGDWPESLDRRLTLAARGESAGLTKLAEQAIAQGAAPAPLLQRLDDALADDNNLPAAGRADAHLAAAQLEKAADHTASARRHLNRAESLVPTSPALWRTRAHLALEQGDNRAARRAARQGMQHAPDDARFNLLLAQAEIRLDNLDAAVAQTDALLERHDGGSELRLALARLYLQEGEPGAARELLRPLASNDDLSATGYFLLGSADKALGNVDSALLYFRQVEEGDEFLPARAGAAWMLVDANRLADARTFLKAQRQRFSGHYNALLMLEAELLDDQGRHADADALLARGLEKTPDTAGLRYRRAMRAWRADDLAGMERDLQRVLEDDPDNVMALNALGYTLADEEVPGRLDDARELVERAHELTPDNPAIQDSLGWVYFRQGQPQKALPPLERAHDSMPDQEVTAHLAEVLHALDKTARARRLVRAALAGADEHPAIDALLERHPELSPNDRE